MSKKEDQPEGARDRTMLLSRIHFLFNTTCLRPWTDLSPGKRIGVTVQQSRENGHASRALAWKVTPCLCQIPDISSLVRRYTPDTMTPDSSSSMAGAQTRVLRGVDEGPSRGRYCSVSESRRIRSSSSSSRRARRRLSSCSCADSSIASRSCSS